MITVHFRCGHRKSFQTPALATLYCQHLDGYLEARFELQGGDYVHTGMCDFCDSQERLRQAAITAVKSALIRAGGEVPPGVELTYSCGHTRDFESLSAMVVTHEWRKDGTIIAMNDGSYRYGAPCDECTKGA
jgi:hypothetical protein